MASYAVVCGHAVHRGSRPIDGPGWRRAHGLLTIGDHVRRYRAIRYPRGSYCVPLPADLLPGWGRT